MDREQVIKGLECLADRDIWCRSDCPYYKDREVNCVEEIAADALALLKEQETVKHGRWIEDETTYAGTGVANWLCSECKRIGGTWWRDISPSKMYRYCPNCGARMDGGTQ